MKKASIYSGLLKKIVHSASNDLNSLDEQSYRSKANPEKWSSIEILGHLVDSAHHNYQRFLLAESKSDLIFPGYDQVLWVRINGYQDRNWDEIILLWKQLNLHIAELISRLPEELIQNRTMDHNFDSICMNLLEKESEASLSYLIWDYIFHMEHHLSQIIPEYQRINEPFKE